jgi:MFS family permease
MNKNLWLLAFAQGLFMTNNVVFIAINGLVGLSLAPFGWMATLPVMGYVVGGAMATPLVAWTQRLYGRKGSFLIGLIVAVLSALLCFYAAWAKNFWLLVAATVIGGYYNANAQLYRFDRRSRWAQYRCGDAHFDGHAFCGRVPRLRLSRTSRLDRGRLHRFP